MACGRHRRHLAGCEECRRGGRFYVAKRELAIANGTWQFPVPIKTVRDHVRKLLAKGMTFPAIADAAQCSETSIRDIGGDGVKARARKTVQGPHAAAILAVPVPARKIPPPRSVRNGMIDATGSRRRVQALAVLDYGCLWQSQALGLAESTVRELAHGETAQVRVGTARLIAELYERYSGRKHDRGRATNVAHAARRHKYVGPDAWDDVTIDDPDARPFDHLRLKKPGKHTVSASTVWVALGGGGDFRELTVAERVEVVTILARRQWSDDRIGAHLRTSGDGIAVFRTRHGIETHYQPIAAYAA